MKRILILLLLSLAACGGDDEEVLNEKGYVDYDLWGYFKIASNLEPEEWPVDYMFFPADNGEKYVEETTNLSGLPKDYEDAVNEMVTLLSERKLKTADGKVKTALLIGSQNVFTTRPEDVRKISGPETVRLPYGRYYVVAFNQQSVKGWAYAGKYCGKYLNVTKETAETVLSVWIPYDVKHKGYIQWNVQEFDNGMSGL